jgi:hypothetical protein
MMGFAARLRGRSDWVDAFFPVTLLHVGHWENFIMGYQICFALFCCLVSALAAVAIQTKRETAFRSGLLAGLLLILIAMTGGYGLAIVPPVAVWIVYLALLEWRLGNKRRALSLMLIAMISIAYMVIYFIGYERPPRHPLPSRDPIAIGMVTGEVLAMALGIGVSGVWWLVAAVEIIIGVGTVAFLVRTRKPEGLPSSAGLIAVAAGVFGVALVIGIGRGSMGLERGLWARYALLSWPLLGMAFLVWVKAGRKWLPILLCGAAAAAFPGNMMTGMIIGSQIREHYYQIESDVMYNSPAEQIVKLRFPDSFNAGQMDRAINNIPLLKSAGIGLFGAGKR